MKITKTAEAVSREKEFTKRIGERDSAAENELFSRFGPRIDLMVSHLLGEDKEDWQDLANNIKIAVLMNLREGKFDPERGTSLYAYICGISRNQIRKYFRNKVRNRLFVNVGQLPESIASAQPKFEYESEEIQKIITSLLEKLEFKYQEVLYLKYYEDLPVKEISARINLPAQKVSERINYAVKLLRKECEKSKIFSSL